MDVVGADDLVRLDEKDVPGTIGFHIQYRDVLEGKYGIKYEEQTPASAALLQHASGPGGARGGTGVDPICAAHAALIYVICLI